MENINVINNTGKGFNVTVNENGNSVEIIIDSISKFKLPAGMKPGDTFKDIDGDDYILWYYMENGDAAILRKEILTEMVFGENNNYNGSNIDTYLSEKYLKELERKFGAENIVGHEVDLLSLDGEDDYGKIRRKVSIPTFDIYRNHKKTIKKFLGKPFLLATPDSTPSGYGSKCVRCVDGNGNVCCDWFGNDGAVRPFFILSSSIFES